MKRLALSLLVAVVGYVLGAVAGYVLIAQLSPNTHDRSVEAAMTAVLVTGPVAALVAFAVAMIRLRRRAPVIQ
jgi:cation transporter-like permease